MFKMKSFRRNLIFILGLWMIIPGIFCGKHGGVEIYDCPAFQDSFYDQWFPYANSQAIRFRTSRGVETTMLIDRVDKTPDYKYYTPGGGSCNPKVTIRSSDVNSSSIHFMLEYSLADQANNLNISLKTIVIQGQNIKDTGINQLTGASLRFNRFQFLSSFIINGKTYPNVQIISRDTVQDKADDIYKLIIAKQVGILAFEEYPSLERWLKQE
jgi:hypothetical protein